MLVHQVIGTIYHRHSSVYDFSLAAPLRRVTNHSNQYMTTHESRHPEHP